MATYELPADAQRLEQDARTAAREEVRQNYPDLYRTSENIANHARALCEQALAATPNITNERQAYIDIYTAAYVEAYETAMQQLDANLPSQA